MPETPQVTVRTTEAGRVTEVVVPQDFTSNRIAVIHGMIHDQAPRAWVTTDRRNGHIAIRQPGGPDVVALAGETLRIVAGRVVRVREDERRD